MINRVDLREKFITRGDVLSKVVRVFCARLEFYLSNTHPHNPQLNPVDSFVVFYLKPNRPVQERFSLSGKEVLCVVSTFATTDYRVISRAKDEIAGAAGRLDSDLIVVICPGDDTREQIQDLTAQEPGVFAAFSFSEIDELQGLVGSECMAVLEERIGSKDLYNIRAAVQRPRDFYGRKPLLGMVATEVLTRGNSVGLFGLRKVGKTSFLLQLLSKMRADKRNVVAHVDFQVVDAVSRTSGCFYWMIAEAVADALGRRSLSHEFRIVGRFDSFVDMERELPEPASALHADLRLLTQKYHVVIAFDEIDLMLRHDGRGAWESEFIQVWRFVRGMCQQCDGRLAVILVGTSPHLVERSQVGGEDNPLLAWVDRQYIGPLSLSESDELLSGVGRKMGLDWKADALQFVFQRAGGHPLLTRLYGSAVVALKPSGRALEVVTAELARDALDAMTRVAFPTLNQILELMREVYPDEYELLRLLACNDRDGFWEFLTHSPEDVAHLEGYGLLRVDGAKSAITISLVEDWIRQAETLRDRQESGGTDGEPVGVVGFELEEVLSREGGFAQVFAGRRVSDGRSAAIKMYRTSDLNHVSREIEVLSGVQHPNIVQILGWGSAADGCPFVAMELLEGESLRMFLTPSRSMSSGEVLDVAADLLAALSTLHPNHDRVAELRRMKEVDADQFAEMQRAGHGFIHRDIKPGNVMMVRGRGAVIIDFNIASRAGSSVVTSTSTVGYLPPGFRTSWAPSVDLYALGLTLAQVGGGVELMSAEGRDGVLRSAESRLDPEVFALITTLMALDDSSRFSSARAALKHVELLRQRTNLLAE